VVVGKFLFAGAKVVDRLCSPGASGKRSGPDTAFVPRIQSQAAARSDRGKPKLQTVCIHGATGALATATFIKFHHRLSGTGRRYINLFVGGTINAYGELISPTRWSRSQQGRPE